MNQDENQQNATTHVVLASVFSKYFYPLLHGDYSSQSRILTAFYYKNMFLQYTVKLFIANKFPFRIIKTVNYRNRYFSVSIIKIIR